MKLTIPALGVIFAASSAMADPAGLRLTKFDVAPHETRVAASIWYPSAGGGDRTVFGGNGVFFGVDVSIWAKVQDAQHPVVLFSHGMGGTFRAQSWLAAGLAERGAIVIAVNHPNSTWGDFDMSAGVRHWTRAQDLSAALDMVMDDPEFEGRIDTDRIMAAGFSYGGWTALTLGGMKGNHAGTVAACKAHINTMVACDMLLSERVNLPGIDADVWNASYADARITHVAALDPGFVWGYNAADVEALVPNTLIVGFGDGEGRMQATNFDESGLTALLPDARIERLAPAYHFSAMPLCKPEGEAILIAEKDDPVCTDPEGGNRAALHADVIEMIAQELGL